MKLFKIFRALLLAILIISSIEILLYALLGKEKIKSSVAENTLFDNQFKKFEVLKTLSINKNYLVKIKVNLFK